MVLATFNYYRFAVATLSHYCRFAAVPLPQSLLGSVTI